MFKGNGGGNLGITRDQRTPAEVSRKETGGWVLDFKIPLAMAFVLGLGSMFLFWAGMWAIRSLGRGGFWFIAALVSGGHLLYIIWMAAKYDDAATANTAVSGFLVSLLTGWFALAVDRVLFMYALQAAQVAPFVGLLVFLVMIAVRYVQDLALFGSPFIEKAIGDVASQEKPPWYAGRLRAPSTRPLPGPSTPRPIPQSGVPTARAAPPAIEPETDGDIPNIYSESNGVFEAPSGAIHTRSDLAEFVQSVGSGVREPKFKVWESKGQGRDHRWWGDMVDVAAMFGLVSPRENGKKIRVLRQDWRVILREIGQGLG